MIQISHQQFTVDVPLGPLFTGTHLTGKDHILLRLSTVSVPQGTTQTSIRKGSLRILGKTFFPPPLSHFLWCVFPPVWGKSTCYHIRPTSPRRGSFSFLRQSFSFFSTHTNTWLHPVWDTWAFSVVVCEGLLFPISAGLMRGKMVLTFLRFFWQIPFCTEKAEQIC